MALSKGPTKSDTSIKPNKTDVPTPSSERCSIQIDLDGATEAAARRDDDWRQNDAAAVVATEDTPYTILSERKKKFLLFIASFAAAISPFSTSTYYPSVVALSQDLQVSVSKVNLTISTYQIFQGVAPTFTAAFADLHGRRPAFLLCFIIYFGANLGLALQDSYSALLVLRCIQSFGSSGTSVLAQAVVTDIATRAERGKYLAYGMIGATVGPAMGPVIGGLLTQSLGWQSIFWFLLTLGSTIFVLIFSIFPETARSIVGDGSVPAQWWNQSLFDMMYRKGAEQRPPAHHNSVEHRRAQLNLFTSLTILRNGENSILCLAGGLLYAGYTAVTSVFASQLEQRFHYNAVQTGLCYLPIAFGSLLSAVTTVRLIDWSFRRQAKKQGLSIVKNQQQDITHFDTEKARLAFSFPMVLLSSSLLIAYGWEMEHHAPLPVILVTMFFLANLVTGSLVSNLALLTDLNQTNAAPVGAAVNLTRCLLSAGGVAMVGPAIAAIGIGWMATIMAGIWSLVLLGFGLVYSKGFAWRVRKIAEQEQRKDCRIKNHDGDQGKHKEHCTRDHGSESCQETSKQSVSVGECRISINCDPPEERQRG